MKKVFKKLIFGLVFLLNKILFFIPTKSLARALSLLIGFWAQVKSPKEGMILLLEIKRTFKPHLSNILIKYEKNSVHPKHRLIPFHEFFYKRISAGERVLDIGSSNGSLTSDIAEKTGAKMTGIEINKNNYEDAVKNFSHPNVYYIFGDALKDVPEEPFDTVMMSNVLEHIDKRVEFIQKVQATAKPNRWLFRVPVYDREWEVPMMDEVGVDSRLDDSHFIEYTEESFTNELKQAGLKPKYLKINWSEIWCEAVPI